MRTRHTNRKHTHGQSQVVFSYLSALSSLLCCPAATARVPLRCPGRGRLETTRRQVGVGVATRCVVRVDWQFDVRLSANGDKICPLPLLESPWAVTDWLLWSLGFIFMNGKLKTTNTLIDFIDFLFEIQNNATDWDKSRNIMQNKHTMYWVWSFHFFFSFCVSHSWAMNVKHLHLMMKCGYFCHLHHVNTQMSGWVMMTLVRLVNMNCLHHSFTNEKKVTFTSAKHTDTL